MSAVVEKLAGRINPNVINTGSHKSKKEDLMVESKIITNRFNFLVENRKFETDKDLELFMEDYIAEVSYLRTQGYDSKVIEEAAGLFSTLSSIFGHKYKS